VCVCVLADAVLRKKWKNLRDYFGTEYSKRPVARSGDGADDPPSTSKWQYFNRLLFLKDIVAPRKSSGSLGSLVNSDIETASEAAVDSLHCSLQDLDPISSVESVDPELASHDATDTPDGTVSGTTSHSLPTPQETPTPQRSRGKKRKGDSLNHYEKLLELEQQKIKLLADRNTVDDTKDDDFLFLKSLLPYIKRIPDERKMSFRSRVQLLVEEYAYGMATNPPGNRHSNEHYQRRSSTTPPQQANSTYTSSPPVETYQSGYDSSNPVWPAESYRSYDGTISKW
ncbi:uncharacterized protein LOC143302354, partial [Babylonia areolata]|uniref:uncharacterized protein LOC143302354 n=1 Tax=Babylonia areolata TaxID=304850 RepID=UPI003FCF6EE6